MSRLPKTSGLPRSGIPRPLSHQQAPVHPQRQAPEVEARTTGSLSATTQRTTQIRSLSNSTQMSSNNDDVFRMQSTQPGTSKSLRSSNTETTKIHSKTDVKITKPTEGNSTVVTTNKCLNKCGVKRQSKKTKSTVPILPSSALRKQVALHVKGQMSKAIVGSKVTAIAKKKTKVLPLEEILTPSGPQQVLQKVITEKRVERSRHGEIVSRNLKAIEKDPRTGETVQIEEEFQQLNPDYPALEGSLKETVAILTEEDITQSFETRRENVVRETIKLNTDVGMEYTEVKRLVEEEKEDVENLLKCNPPDLINQAPALYPLHKRLNALKLTPENIVIIEKSVINPRARADEALPDLTPEINARIMETSELALLPSISPQRIFKTLFGIGPNDDSFMIVSSVTPGPLEDIVVPTAIPRTIHEEMLTTEMEQASFMAQSSSVTPPHDSFVESKPSKPRKRGRRRRHFFNLSHESPPWDVDMHTVIEAVGALPKANVNPSDLDEAKKHGRMGKALVRGIEYVLESDPVQYSSKVQLRGTCPPPCFPGYMVALSDTSNIVEVAKSPSQVLFSAWKSVQPDVFSDDSILYN